MLYYGYGTCVRRKWRDLADTQADSQDEPVERQISNFRIFRIFFGAWKLANRELI